MLSKVEPKDFKTTIPIHYWVNVMQEEVRKFDRLKVCELVLPPDCAMIIALKRIFKVKLDEHNVVLKTRQGLLLRDIVYRKALI